MGETCTMGDTFTINLQGKQSRHPRRRLMSLSNVNKSKSLFHFWAEGVGRRAKAFAPVRL